MPEPGAPPPSQAAQSGAVRPIASAEKASYEKENMMKIGILGTGHIGATLAIKLSAAGHDVKVANSRGPETIDVDLLKNGARAVTSGEAVIGVDVVIMSTPLGAIPRIAPLFADVPAETVVIDTSNYYPKRDGEIAALEGGQAESEWVAGQLGRPIAKAWNAITSASFAEKGRLRRGAWPDRHSRRCRWRPGARNCDGARRRDRARRRLFGHIG